MLPLGRILFALGLGLLGLLSLVHRDFALTWQPVPEGVPQRALLACFSGAILVAGALGLAWRRGERAATAGLAAFVTSWLVLLQFPRVAAAPGQAYLWLGFGENVILVAGGWCLWTRLEGVQAPAWLGTACRVGYALFLPVIGLSHFVYADATAALVPAWLPFRLGFAYLTGAAHMAAGLGLLLSVWPRLAAALEAAMLGGFVLLLHLPAVGAAPRDRLQWTMLAVATAYTGAAWILAASVPRSPARVSA